MMDMASPLRIALRDSGHLDALEIGRVGGLRVVSEVWQLADPSEEVREQDGERVHVGMLGRERLADLLGIVPGQLHGHRSSRRRRSSVGLRVRSMIRRANGSVAWLRASIDPHLESYSSLLRAASTLASPASICS